LSGYGSLSNLKKAYIQVLNSSGTVNDKNLQIPVFFNPSEYSIDKNNHFSENSSKQSKQFVKKNLQTLTMELIFDTYEQKVDVRNFTKKIANLLEIDSKTKAPPIVTFVWGGPVFTGVLTRVNQKFTLFSSDGIPLRAILNVTFEEHINEKVNTKENMSVKTEDKVHTIKQNEEIHRISSDFFDDPSLWRAIAKNNSIDNPRLLKTGSKIIVPKLDK